MRVLVTGATGFVGSHLAKALVKKGHETVVTYRDRSRLKVFDGLDLEAVKADVTSFEQIRKAAKGCELVFHVAGVVASRPRELVWRLNALAPEVVTEAAASSGVRRVVVTSSVAGLGPAPEGKVGDESMVYHSGKLGLVYVDSKHEGESRALAVAAQGGVEVVVVNPSYVLGPEDPTGTSTRIVGNFVRGRLAAVVDANTNIVDIDDVVEGHIKAALKGRAGERYILGGHNVNWPSLIKQLAQLSGVKYPVMVLPPESAAFAKLRESVGLYMPVSAEGIELMRQNWTYSSAKAKRELGYKSRPLKSTLKRTADWYKEKVESGAYSGPDLSTMRALAQMTQYSDRLGLLPALDRVARLAGRRLVV